LNLPSHSLLDCKDFAEKAIDSLMEFFACDDLSSLAIFKILFVFDYNSSLDFYELNPVGVF
jgi:hypothetical protein